MTTKSRFFDRRHLLVLLAVSGGLGFTLLTSEVLESLGGSPELVGSIDQEVWKLLAPFRTGWLTAFAVTITWLGSKTALIAFAAIIAACLALKRRYLQAAQVVVASFGGGVLTYVLKHHFERARPPHSVRLVEAGGFSYPSGHALAATAVYFSAALILSGLIDSTKHKLMILFVSLFFIAMVDFSRIYLGVHYPSDVMAGTLAGISWASFVVLIFQLTTFEKNPIRS